MQAKKGFTIIEIIILLVFAGLVSALVFVQKYDLEAFASDDQQKSTLNAMYYALENVFYPAHGYYPETINENNLPTVLPELWDSASSIHYSPTSCDFQGHCAGYTLTVRLQKEMEYIKKNK